MQIAIITEEFRIFVEGETRVYAPGDRVGGYLAQKALSLGKAKKARTQKNLKAAPENKAT